MKKLVSLILALATMLTLGAAAAFAKKKEAPKYTASDLKPGRYEIEVAVSSSKIIVESCTLQVSETGMIAEMTMYGSKTDAMYLGSASNAKRAYESSGQSGIIFPDKNDSDRQVYTIRVEALDSKIECAAYNAETDEWKDRILMFQSEGLPESAFRSDGKENSMLIIIPIVIVAIAAVGAAIVVIKKRKKK